MNLDNVLIIAEAGVNHNGDIERAKKLIDIAKKAGADAVKFQSFKADKLVSKNAKKATYQINNMGSSDDYQFNMLKSLELNHMDHKILIEECKNQNITFLSTAFDVDGVDYLDNLNIPLFKIPSGEITNYPYLKRIASKKKPVIMSTGMANINEIEEALDVLIEGGVNKEDVTILHCNTEYPTPFDNVNLLAMNWMAEKLKIKTGYSDHTLGIEVPVAAVALGARVIEKHFTLDRSLPGPDHAASLEPSELRDMVLAIRNTEEAIAGSGKKELSESETKNINIARKSIHTIRAIKKGEVLQESDLISLRPGSGISPMKWQSIIGKKVKRDYDKYEIIELSSLS